MALPFFAITLFVSAFLLFLVQPMIGKMILPKLGGTPQVWNTVMVFFQTALLAGYAYTHTVSTRLSVRKQIFVHCGVLLLPLLVLFLWPYGPFNVADPVGPDGKPIVVDGVQERGWIPNPTAPPIPQTLILLASMVGLPFLVVATTSPLLQKWFGSTGHPAAKDPYFLSIASNFGSMLALLSYPFIVEPLLGLRDQAWVWTFGYMVLAVGVAGAAFLVLQAPPSVQLAGVGIPEGSTAEMPVPPPPVEPAPAPPKETAIKPAAAVPSAPQRGAIRRGSKQRGKQAAQRSLSKVGATTPSAPITRHPSIVHPPRPFEMTNWRRLRWVGLAAIPSSLMLGITTYMSTDISAIPLFWVIPLALYLLSFILVFMRWPVQWTEGPHTLMLIVQPFCLAFLALILLTHSINPVYRAVAVCLLAFFTTALVCHGEMARDRPPTRYLTEFYLWMSVGGMVGGMFNALFAPLMFTWLLELPLAVLFAALLRPKLPGGGWTDTFLGSTLPDLAAWFNKTGDEIYTQFRSKPPETAAPGNTPAPLVQHAPRGWLLGLTLDLLLPALVTLVAAFLIWNGMSNAQGGWKWRLANKDNGLFMFFWKSLGSKQEDAYGWTMFAAYGLMFGLPLLLAVLTMSRPLRFGLALGGILLVTYLQEGWAEQGRVLAAERSYFGILRVMKEDDRFGEYTYLMHGTTHHGLNYRPDVVLPVFDANGRPVPSKTGKGSELRSLSRLATTYYHRLGPVGVVMEKTNWFNGQYGIVVKDDKGEPEKDDKGKPKIEPKLEYRVNYLGTFNDYSADARLPVSVVGGLTGDLMGGMVPGLGPMTPVVAAWSEPPYATIGLGTGTMASYGRPYQHVVYYEIDEQIRNFNLHGFSKVDGDPYFTYVINAINRGVKLEIVMGDARLSMKEEREQKNTTYTRDPGNTEPGPHYIESTSFPKREHYYRAINVDAFSSDAIPVHLITEEAIAMYMSKLIKYRPPLLDSDKPYLEDAKGDPILDAWGNRMPNYKRDKEKRIIDPGCHGGILCVHTSNRHVDLVKPVTDVAKALRPSLKWRVGKDQGGRDLPREITGPKELLHIGHFGQEYVMLAESELDLPRNTTKNDPELTINPSLHWSTPAAPGNRVWTDDYSYLMGVFRWGFKRGE